ncbi:universal stress protein [Candidatus Phyllobacterium onerii]|uniref:universal stress protein n=1 Tax=Candidatus Phyllobacterium onerii TaxID=3020828 RepID=UPI002330C094|nr:universal stress protein [Phyllobacterium sp. IY22]
MLLATGVPMIVIPSTWRKAFVAEKVLVGWNASPVARRAITDSLPLLMGAQSVCVLVIDANSNARHGEEPGADTGLYMSRHGLKVTVENIRSEGRPIADVLQDMAGRNGYDLIVIGAFGHSRTRDMFFGDVTRSLLAQARVPLLLAH